jgi:hypothetical protein
VTAAVAGLMLVLIPLATIADIEHESATSFPTFARQGLQSLDNPYQPEYYSRIQQYEVDVLAFSFFVAVGAYVSFRRKKSDRERRTIGPFVY